VSTAEIKILKPVDTAPKSVTMHSVEDREFWITLRHARLMELAVIEKKLGIVRRRCRYCESKNVVDDVTMR
jgi:hypothetical protein